MASAGAHLFLKGDLFTEHYTANEEVVLGVGTSGSVVEAECRRTGRKAAVKSYQLKEMSRKQLRNLGGELAVHASLSHPGIVKVEGIYEGDEAIRLVTECLHGGELFDRVLDDGPLSEDKAILVTRQLLQTMVYLHSRHLVHRDVKMENVMFEESGGWRAKLIDFGFATKVDPVTKLDEKVGTLQYAAPELVQGTGYDEQVDVWGLGCTLYSMLTGQLCYVGDDDEVIAKCRSGLIDYGTRFEQLSTPAQEFIRHLLTVDPAARPSAKEALEHSWLSEEIIVPAIEKASPAKQQVLEPMKPEATMPEPTKLERTDLSRLTFPEMAYQMTVDLFGMLWLSDKSKKFEEPDDEYDGPLRVVIELDAKDEN